MSDPRADNCKAYHLNTSGQVDGVDLMYEERAATKYRLVQVRLIDEASAGGNTVATFAVVNKGGAPVSENVYLAWPYPNLTNRLLPGNQNNQHMISNGYNAAGGHLGPLAIYVGDAKGNPISDVIGGLGLPNNRHVSFSLVFQERGASDEGGGGGSTDLSAVMAKLDKLDTKITDLALHLGLDLD